MAIPALSDRTARPAPKAARAVAHLIAEPDAMVVCVHGEIDLCTVRTLETALRNAAAASAPAVVADLRSVGFMDGAGLRALRWAQLRLEKEGRSFAVRGARRAVLRLIEAAEAEDLLEPAAATLALR